MKSIFLPLAFLLLASSASAFFSPPSSSKSLSCTSGSRRQQHTTRSDLHASKAKQKAESRTAWSEKRGHGSTSANDVQQSSHDNNSKSTTTGRDTPPRLIIAGAPASGKGTQCELIKQRYGVVHLSTGDMLRAAVSAGTDVGKTAKEYMDSGKLVPDEVIIGVVSIYINLLLVLLTLAFIAK
jgi:adenylate kinase